MIAWLLRHMGVRDEHPEPRNGYDCCPESPAERRFDRAKREAERTIRRADFTTERVKRQTPSWEELFRTEDAS